MTLCVRAWQAEDDPALRRLLEAQMRLDPGWPPDYARGGDLAAWLGAPAHLGRWVAVDENRILGHVGNAPVHPGPIADLWAGALGCGIARMAEVCRLVVDPDARGRGVSARLTRQAVRAAVESGRVPVAYALMDRASSLAMMVGFGWAEVGRAESPSTGSPVVALIPPRKLIDAALGGH